MIYNYYKVIEIRQEYLGIRYFRFKRDLDSVTQVVFNGGDLRRSKASNVGVYLIMKQTFLTNYFGMGYIEECTEKEFTSAFKQIVKLLK